MYSYICLFLYLIIAVFFLIKCRENSPIFYLGIAFIVLRTAITVLVSYVPRIIGNLHPDLVFIAHKSLAIFNNTLKSIEIIVFIVIIGIIIYKDIKETKVRQENFS